jgi:hypothetical protein
VRVLPRRRVGCDAPLRAEPIGVDPSRDDTAVRLVPDPRPEGADVAAGAACARSGAPHTLQ